MTQREHISTEKFKTEVSPSKSLYFSKIAILEGRHRGHQHFFSTNLIHIHEKPRRPSRGFSELFIPFLAHTRCGPLTEETSLEIFRSPRQLDRVSKLSKNDHFYRQCVLKNSDLLEIMSFLKIKKGVNFQSL